MDKIRNVYIRGGGALVGRFGWGNTRGKTDVVWACPEKYDG